jgi:hypothetical protein
MFEQEFCGYANGLFVSRDGCGSTSTFLVGRGEGVLCWVTCCVIDVWNPFGEDASDNVELVPLFAPKLDFLQACRRVNTHRPWSSDLERPALFASEAIGIEQAKAVVEHQTAGYYIRSGPQSVDFFMPLTARDEKWNAWHNMLTGVRMSRPTAIVDESELIYGNFKERPMSTSTWENMFRTDQHGNYFHPPALPVPATQQKARVEAVFRANKRKDRQGSDASGPSDEKTPVKSPAKSKSKAKSVAKVKSSAKAKRQSKGKIAAVAVVEEAEAEDQAASDDVVGEDDDGSSRVKRRKKDLSDTAKLRQKYDKGVKGVVSSTSAVLDSLTGI